MKVNERPYFKGIDIGKILDEGLSKAAYSKKPTREIIAELLELKSQGIESFRKVSKGLETIYQCEVNDFRLVVCTSWIASKRAFRDDDQVWVLIIDHRNPHLFFSFPINRTKYLFKRLFKTASIYRMVAEYWPVCPSCKEKFYWTMVQSDDFEVIDEQFHDRVYVCKNEKCEQCGVSTNKLVTEIELPNEKDRRYFTAPFERARKTRRKNRLEGTQTIPRRLIRFWSKLGVKIPREHSQKGKFLYNEEIKEEGYNEENVYLWDGKYYD